MGGTFKGTFSTIRMGFAPLFSGSWNKREMESFHVKSI